MNTYIPTQRTKVRRLSKRAVYDKAQVHAILDEGLVCHVGFVVDGQPFVLPTTYARVGEHLYLHGSVASRMLTALEGGTPLCVTVTLLDGLVLARSAFHHSMNYRSVIVLGVASVVTDEQEKRKALDAIVEHVVPHRRAEVRGPSPEELRATLVVSLPITEASGKVRTGPPVDLEADYATPCWAGVIPLRVTTGNPEPDPRLAPGTEIPKSVAGYRRAAPESARCSP